MSIPSILMDTIPTAGMTLPGGGLTIIIGTAAITIGTAMPGDPGTDMIPGIGPVGHTIPGFMTHGITIPGDGTDILITTDGVGTEVPIMAVTITAGDITITTPTLHTCLRGISRTTVPMAAVLPPDSEQVRRLLSLLPAVHPPVLLRPEAAVLLPWDRPPAAHLTE